MSEPAAELPPYRLLVTGWRSWPAEAGYVVHWALDTMLRHYVGDRLLVVVHGQCPYGGVDLYAHQWALDNAPRTVPDPHPADFKGLGPSAGPLRNAEMVALGADSCLAFPGPGSKGTKDCMNKAKAAGIPVWPINWNPLYVPVGLRTVPRVNP